MACEVRRFLTRGVEATEALGEALGRRLMPGAVVALSGELGSGKTAFVRGLARGLDVEETATSPTFTLMQEYEGRVPFFHFDAWMAGRETAFLEGGGADYLGGDGVAAIEWAERVAAYLPFPRLEVRLFHRTPDERTLELRLLTPRDASEDAAGTPAAERVAALGAALSALEPREGLIELSDDPDELPRPPSVEGSA